MEKFVVFTLLLCGSALGLDNGLVRTPPMGFLTWVKFACTTDCEKDPENCVSEQLLKAQADSMVEEGYKDAGYEYIIIDDCWWDATRDPKTGKLRPDPTRFPNGIKPLANYIHSLGLKFGIYQDIGSQTCAKGPGLMGHFELDAQTFAEWEVDYVKIDCCYSSGPERDYGFPEFGKQLNKTGRPIVYGCEWPLYGGDIKRSAEVCNVFRGGDDIYDTWDNVKSIIEFYANHQDKFIPVAKPGAWNDLDQLIIGNDGLSLDQAKAQMAIWAMLSSPLLMSTDLRNVREEFKQILQNRDVIAINQDQLGIQARRVFNGTISVFVKPVMPIKTGHQSVAIAVTNYQTLGPRDIYTFTLRSLNQTATKYDVYDVFNHSRVLFKGAHVDQELSVPVNNSGVALLKAIPA